MSSPTQCFEDCPAGGRYGDGNTENCTCAGVWEPPVRGPQLVDAMVRLSGLALRLGRVDRTYCYHPDRQRKENVAEHTVMLGWIAPTLAQALFPGLDRGLIAQLALVHDAVEVYAGDTPTLRITERERLAKAARERAAADRIREEFLATLPWFTALVDEYESQSLPEARYVKAVDKLLPKIVHLLDGLHGIHEQSLPRIELAATLAQQDIDMRVYAGEYDALFELRDLLVSAVLGHDSWEAAGHD
jgi:putative hydrolase of HD superfamily